MSVASFRAHSHETFTRHNVLERAKGDPAYQAFAALRVGFTLLPIVMGVDIQRLKRLEPYGLKTMKATITTIRSSEP